MEREIATKQTSVSTDFNDSLASDLTGSSDPFTEPTFWDDYYHFLTEPGAMDEGLRTGFYVSGSVGLGSAAVAGGVLVAGSVAGTSLVATGGLASATTGVPTMAGNAVIGMGSAGLIGGTVSKIGGGGFISGGVTAAPAGLIGGAVSSLASSLLARAGFSGLSGAIAADGFGGAAAAAVDSRLRGKTLSETLNAAFYGLVTAGLFRAGLHYSAPLVQGWVKGVSTWTPKRGVPSSVGRTNAQLIDEIARISEQWGRGTHPTGTPRHNGTRMHKYAKNLLDRYQRMFGDRGLVTERSFIQGVEVSYGTKGRGIVKSCVLRNVDQAA
jgi:hypothetical protein